MSTASEHDATTIFDPPGTCYCCQQQMLVLQNWIRLGHEQSKSKKYIDDIEKSLILEDEIVARNEAYFPNFQISNPPCIGKSS